MISLIDGIGKVNRDIRINFLELLV